MAIGANYNRAEGQYYINTQKLIHRGANTTNSVVTREGTERGKGQYYSSYQVKTARLKVRTC